MKLFIYMTLTGPSRAYYEAKALKSKLSEIPFNHDFCIISDANAQDIYYTRKPTRTASKVLPTDLHPLRMT